MFKQALLGFTCFLAGLISAVGITSYSEGLKLEVGFGQGRYQKSPDGMWWQKDQWNSSRYKDNGAFEIGIAGKLNPAYGWALRYVSLGNAHTNAIAVACPDDDCTKRDHSLDLRRPECAERNTANCQNKFVGDGGMKGVSFSLNTELFRYKSLSLDGEAGALFYFLKWSEQTYPLGCEWPQCKWRDTQHQRSNYFLSPMIGAALRLEITKDISVFIKTDVYLRTQQHMPIATGIGGYAQTWFTGLQVSL